MLLIVMVGVVNAMATGLVLIIPVAHHALAPRARSRHSTPGLHALRVSHHSEADR